ncbi:DNA repair protein XRCC3 homolog [Cajanus cajan]|uniref:DNA repair protein XRCC3 isogeny n=1 Tax=Cajanus cajan TaxID=3821 RepID=A0A151S7L4_CAJCA|nr:DNA repair protein XRCC3 homolog [Cajanus cajan]KYP50758.1 DNA repair protein XRCC3 isogeny [Cajanus cajan]
MRSQKCTMGCPALDRFLAGGVPCDSVTEFVGESGCGKTQLCLQLALSAQLPPSRGGLSASAIFIHTEFPFPLRRLRHLSRAFRASNPTLPCPDPCDRVFVRAVHSAEELLHAIPTIEAFLLHSRSRWRPVRIIVIDSIAALFRSDFDNTGSDLRRRSSLFFRISGGLRRLARGFGLAVVVTNQVVDFIGEGEVRVGNLGNGLYSSGRRVCPALGLAWAHCVNSRVFLSRDENEPVKTRRMSIVFAPHLPHSSCEYVIKGDGVFGLEMQQQQHTNV